MTGIIAVIIRRVTHPMIGQDSFPVDVVPLTIAATQAMSLVTCIMRPTSCNQGSITGMGLNRRNSLDISNFHAVFFQEMVSSRCANLLPGICSPSPVGAGFPVNHSFTRLRLSCMAGAPI